VTGLLELAERCESATGPDRNLNCAIFATVHPEKFEGSAELYARVDWTRNIADWGWLRDLGMPAYTASIDAAMTLVPEIKNRIVSTTEGLGHSVAYVRNGSITNPDVVEYSGSAKSTPLAICAAALRSRTNGDDV
jgi:hypothetical protein